MFRNEEKLFDGTLASDVSHQIQAHKIILSAGSDFFRNIFSQCNQNNMLVYLKGISVQSHWGLLFKNLGEIGFDWTGSKGLEEK